MPTELDLSVEDEEAIDAAWERLEAEGFTESALECAGPACAPPLDVPDERQDEGWSCGAAAVTAVARFFGVEPDTEPEAVLALGSSPRDGTDPERIIAALEGAGLSTTAVSCADLDDLAYHVSKGRPCVCCCQAWGNTEEVAALESGHWVVVCGVTDTHVQVMDPARFDPSEVAGEYGGESLGDQKIAVPRERFLERWKDQDAAANLYDRYLIAAKGPTDARPPA